MGDSKVRPKAESTTFAGLLYFVCKLLVTKETCTIRTAGRSRAVCSGRYCMGHTHDYCASSLSSVKLPEVALQYLPVADELCKPLCRAGKGSRNVFHMGCMSGFAPSKSTTAQNFWSGVSIVALSLTKYFGVVLIDMFCGGMRPEMRRWKPTFATWAKKTLTTCNYAVLSSPER